MPRVRHAQLDRVLLGAPVAHFLVSLRINIQYARLVVGRVAHVDRVDVDPVDLGDVDPVVDHVVAHVDPVEELALYLIVGHVG